jgi:hypothetical protein
MPMMIASQNSTSRRRVIFVAQRIGFSPISAAQRMALKSTAAVPQRLVRHAPHAGHDEAGQNEDVRDQSDDIYEPHRRRLQQPLTNSMRPMIAVTMNNGVSKVIAAPW